MNKEDAEYNKINNENLAEMQDYLEEYMDIIDNMEKMIKIDPKYSDDPDLDKHLIILALFQIVDILNDRGLEALELEEEEDEDEDEDD